MAPPKRAFQGLAPWRPLVATQEVVSHALLAWFAIAAGIGYLGLMAVFAAELLLGNLVSVAMYPERGAKRHAWDLVKFVFAMGLLLGFVVATYTVARQGGGGTELHVHDVLPDDTGGALRWSIAFAALSIAVRYLLARREPDPKFAWARSVLVQNAATFVTLLLMIFVAAFAGAAIGGVAELAGVEAPIDTLLILVTAGMRLFFALLVSRMPEREMRSMAQQPYID